MTLLNCVHIWWRTGRICAWWNSCSSGQLLLPWLHHVFDLPSLLQYQAIDWNVNWPIQSTKTWPSDWSIVLLHESVWQAPNKQGLHCTCACLCLPVCLLEPLTANFNSNKSQWWNVSVYFTSDTSETVALEAYHDWSGEAATCNYVWTLR